MSLRQIASMGWREFFNRSTTPRAESSRKMWLSVGQQVILGGGAHGFNQAAAQFALEETNDAADLLQRKAALAQFADHGNFSEVVERIDALMAVASGNDDAALVPPLQLTQADAGQSNHVAGCKGRLQVKDPETKVSANV